MKVFVLFLFIFNFSSSAQSSQKIILNNLNSYGSDIVRFIINKTSDKFERKRV